MLKLQEFPPQKESTSTPSVSVSVDAPQDALLLLKGFLGRVELAKELALSPRTLDRLHALRDGPARLRVGRKILYNIESVRKWLLSREQQPPSTYKQRTSSRRKKYAQGAPVTDSLA